MSDATRLLNELEDYAGAFEFHLAKLRDEAVALERIWFGVRDIYQGRGAEVFADAYSRSRQMIAAYAAAGEIILPLLKERIDQLRHFDSSAGM